MPRIFTTAQIADLVQGGLVGDPLIELTGFAPADTAKAGELTFAEKSNYVALAERGAAGAIVVGLDCAASTKTLIRVANPRLAVSKLLPLFFPEDAEPAGIHPSAVVADSAVIHASAHIGANCVVGERVVIGARCALLGGNHVRRDCELGDDVVLHPNVVLYPKTKLGNRVQIHAGTVIGSDGYGYVFDQGRHHKMPQVGRVVIGDDVEIGANTAVDRGALGPTVIGAGTKIDNLVHVAHNVSFGRHCLIMGQSGFAGSTSLGDYCVVASQSGHLTLGPQATIGAKSGVMRDVPAKGTVLGIPAQPDKQTKRQWIALQQLPELLKEVRELRQQLAELTVKNLG
jgi:UDP-3-O-[3-hydroxymyristoyl] glucosamine N-acyltransferase